MAKKDDNLTETIPDVADGVVTKTKAPDAAFEMKDVLLDLEKRRADGSLRVWIYGHSVLGEEKVTVWFETPNSALENQKPIDLVGTAHGNREVVEVLKEIETGRFTASPMLMK